MILYDILLYMIYVYSYAIFKPYDFCGGGGEGARGAAEEVGREPPAKCGWGAHGDTVVVGCWEIHGNSCH